MNQVGDAINLETLKNDREKLRGELSGIEAAITAGTDYVEASSIVKQKQAEMQSGLLEPLRARAGCEKFAAAINSVEEAMKILTSLIETEANSTNMEELKKQKAALEQKIEGINEKLRKIRERRK